MTNKRQFIKVKEWIIDKAQETARRYNCYIDTQDAGNGFVTVLVDEVLKETEKAVYVRLSTGDVVGSYKGWRTWIPKSQIVLLEV